MNYNSHFYGVGGGAPEWVHVFGPLLILLVIWSVVWKGLGLWHSAKKSHPVWFVVILLVNTAGILEIIYLFGILKLKAAQLFSKR